MPANLTTTAIRNLKRGQLSDHRVPGLSVRVSGGRRLWSYRYRMGKRQPRISLGEFPSVSLADARARAAELSRLVAMGEDPALSRDEKRGEMTVGELVDRALKEHWELRRKASTANKVRRNYELHFKRKFGQRGIGSIARPEVVKWHQSLGRKSPGAANRTLAYMSKAFSLAIEWGLLESNPCKGITKFKERRVERYLSPDELQRLRTATDEFYSEGMHEPALAVVWWLLLTGMRSSEALGLTWDDIDAEQGVVYLRDSKTGARTVPVSSEALRIIQALPQKSKWVFYAERSPTKPIRALWGYWRKIRERAGIEDVRVHDLRHSHASMLVKAGVHVSVIQSLLGHASITTSARYMHVGREQEARALDAVAKALGG